jgi:hypothetical protein
MSTNVPAAQFTPAGLVVPTESAIKAGLWADFQAAFGGNLNESDATPQGQLVTSLAATIGASNDLLLQLVNLVDPAFSSGRMQDAIGRIYYLTRIAATSTLVDATCSGAIGTIIPAGSLALASDGTIYQSLGEATIGSGGSVIVSFAAIQTGPIACPTGSLSTIYRVVPGWDTITNLADGIIGRDEETRAEFEKRRSASVAGNATGILGAIRASVLSVTGVIDAYVTENATDTAATVGGVTIAANSLYVAVSGGTNADVARAIWSKKAPGCAYTGATTVTVTDTDGYSTPYPTYAVKFTRASALPIFVTVTLADNGQVPAGAGDLVKAAIVAAFNGDDGGERARIGATVYALRFAPGIATLGTWCQIKTITVGTTASPTASEVAVNINKIPTIDPDNIEVVLA